MHNFKITRVIRAGRNPGDLNLGDVAAIEVEVSRGWLLSKLLGPKKVVEKYYRAGCYEFYEEDGTGFTRAGNLYLERLLRARVAMDRALSIC